MNGPVTTKMNTIMMRSQKGASQQHVLADQACALVEIDGKLYKALVDSGVDDCCVRKSLLSAMDLASIGVETGQSNIVCIMADGSRVRAEGWAQLPIKLDNVV